MVGAGWAHPTGGLGPRWADRRADSDAGTLYEWKKKYPEISEALKKGKEVVDIQVENALLKRALGYEYVEDKVEMGPNGKKVTQTIKQVIPDTTAQIFWLKNRRPDKWRDKQLEVNSTGDQEALSSLYDALEEPDEDHETI